MRTMIQGPVTVEDLLSGPWPESGELWDGVFLVRSPSGGWHGAVGACLASMLRQVVTGGVGGIVLDASAGYVVARGPDRVAVRAAVSPASVTVTEVAPSTTWALVTMWPSLS